MSLIVSLTSFPARIRFVPQVIGCLRKQTRPADAILLWLSAEQFPDREASLPAELLEAVRNGAVSLRWTEGDLKPHKKYLGAFREFPDDVIVTVDDDVLYGPTLLEDLWNTRLRYPGAVVAGRTHLITLDPSGQPRHYAQWLRRTLGFEEGPAMQLFAVGIGGVLYEPKWFPPELYDTEVIRNTCLLADDVWLKVMEMAAGVPVVRSEGTELLRLIPGSQETSLFSANLEQSRNDEILTAVRAWADGHFGRDVVAEALADSRFPRVRDEEELMAFINSDRTRLIVSANTALARERSSKEKAVERLRRQLDKQVRDNEQLRASLSYRLGSRIVSPFSKLLSRKKQA